MICMDSVVLGFDGSDVMPLEYNTSNIGKSKVQNFASIELGKKLLQSAREGDIESVHDLMNKGAPFSTDWLGFSPLHLAVINNHIELCEMLLRAGIGKDGRTKVERTPLHFAAYHGHLEILKLLLCNGAEVDCQDMLRMTPLHWAVENCHQACACLLLNFGADSRAESKFRKTPLSIAVEMNWTDMIELLSISTNEEATKSIIDLQPEISINETEETIPTEKMKETNNPTNEHIIDLENEDCTIDVDENLPQMDVTNEATIQLLKDHGITMLPTDNTNTITSAFQSGRQIVLSDAGKLVLRECKVANESSKHLNTTKKTTVVPTTKLKDAKVVTVSSSQFLAMTGQSKPNILQKLPVSVKNSNNLNFIHLTKSPTKLSTLPRNLTISSSSQKQGQYTIVKKVSGNMVKKGEVIPISQLSQTIKSKIVQLQNRPNLKIIFNNQNLGKMVTKNIKTTSNDAFNTSPKKNDRLVDELTGVKSELEFAKMEIENYKKRILELESELDHCKNKIIDLETNSISLG